MHAVVIQRAGPELCNGLPASAFRDHIATVQTSRFSRNAAVWSRQVILDQLTTLDTQSLRSFEARRIRRSRSREFVGTKTCFGPRLWRPGPKQ